MARWSLVGDAAGKVDIGHTIWDHVVAINYLFIQQIFTEYYLSASMDTVMNEKGRC